MHFSVTVLFLFLGASLNYKDDCSSAPCVDTALVCNADTNKCACADTHFPNNADDACVQSKYFGKFGSCLIQLSLFVYFLNWSTADLITLY